MAGHSHSANIAVRKNAQDKARAKLFTKLMKEVYVAVKTGGPDISANATLRAAIARAKAQSVPKDNIDRAINKAGGAGDDASYEEVTMEGYGPGGVAIMARCLTDNRNRTASEVRLAFSRGGGNLGTTGCVGYLFQRKGIILVKSEDEDAVMMTALDSGAEDVSEEDDGFEVVTPPEDFDACLAGLEDAGFELGTAEVMMVPDTRVDVDGKKAVSLLRMLERLDDCDDVQQIHHNATIPDSAREAYADS